MALSNILTSLMRLINKKKPQCRNFVIIYEAPIIADVVAEIIHKIKINRKKKPHNFVFVMTFLIDYYYHKCYDNGCTWIFMKSLVKWKKQNTRSVLPVKLKTRLWMKSSSSGDSISTKLAPMLLHITWKKPVYDELQITYYTTYYV